jgi:hypothetical protein
MVRRDMEGVGGWIKVAIVNGEELYIIDSNYGKDSKLLVKELVKDTK